MADKKNTYTAEYTRMAKPVEMVNPETGEVVVRYVEEKLIRAVEVSKEYLDIKVPKKSRFNNGDFITIFQNPLLEIIKNEELTKNEMKLLLYLIASCGSQNSIKTDFKTLTADLKIADSNLSKALKGLVERNIVIRKDGDRYKKSPLPIELHLSFDQLNYRIGYKGSPKHFGSDKHTHPLLMQKDGENPLVCETKKLEYKKTKQIPAPLPTIDDVFFNPACADYDASRPIDQDPYCGMSKEEYEDMEKKIIDDLNGGQVQRMIDEYTQSQG